MSASKNTGRRPVSPDTLDRVAAEIAGIPVAPSKAIAQAAELEEMLQELDKFRALPLKDIAMPVIFLPETGDSQ